MILILICFERQFCLRRLHIPFDLCFGCRFFCLFFKLTCLPVSDWIVLYKIKLLVFERTNLHYCAVIVVLLENGMSNYILKDGKHWLNVWSCSSEVSLLCFCFFCCRSCRWSKPWRPRRVSLWTPESTYQANPPDSPRHWGPWWFWSIQSSSAYLSCLCWTKGGNSLYLPLILWTKLSLEFCQPCKKNGNCRLWWHYMNNLCHTWPKTVRLGLCFL